MHLVQAVDAGRGLLGDTADLGRELGPLLRGLAEGAVQQGEDVGVLLAVRGRRVRGGAGLLELDALVDEEGGVATVVQDHVRAAGGSVRPGQRLLRAPPVLFERLALPGEDRDARGGFRGAVRADRDGGGSVVLGGEDVAGGPADLGAEGDQGLDEHGGLHGHVQRTGDPGAGQGLGGGELLADRHQAGHLVLGERDLLAPERGEGEVGDLEVLAVGGRRHNGLLLVMGRGWAVWADSAARRGTRMPGRSQCSPSEALCPSPGPLPPTGRPPSAATSVIRIRIYTERPSEPQPVRGEGRV